MFFFPFMWRQLSSKTTRIAFSNVVEFGSGEHLILFFFFFNKSVLGGAFLATKFYIKSEDRRSRLSEFSGLFLIYFFPCFLIGAFFTFLDLLARVIWMRFLFGFRAVLATVLQCGKAKG